MEVNQTALLEQMQKAYMPLMDWFSEEARVLPWRSNPQPYWVWISEVMLQQTRVEAVKPYFARFIEAIPDVRTLAAVEDGVLMKLWEGLGYYSRARNLKKAAIVCMEQYGGSLPDCYEELLSLPGIGSYTAGAIASIAYGQLVPAVDGNVLRVISRLLASREDIGKPAVKKQMEQLLSKFMENSRPDSGKFNQALMELGALVCLPNGEPHCLICPWMSICETRIQGAMNEIPVKAKKKARKIEELTVFVVELEDLRLLHKRPDKGLLAGLYELPNVKGHITEEEAETLWENQIGSSVKVNPLENGTHIFSHIEWHMKAYQIQAEPKKIDLVRETEIKGVFLPKETIKKQYALPSAFRTWNRYMTE